MEAAEKVDTEKPEIKKETAMKTPLSPLDIEVLIKCNCSSTPDLDIVYPAVKESIDMFVSCGMIHKSGDYHQMYTSVKGKAMVEALGQTTLPEYKISVDPASPEGDNIAVSIVKRIGGQAQMTHTYHGSDSDEIIMKMGDAIGKLTAELDRVTEIAKQSKQHISDAERSDLLTHVVDKLERRIRMHERYLEAWEEVIEIIPMAKALYETIVRKNEEIGDNSISGT